MRAHMNTSFLKPILCKLFILSMLFAAALSHAATTSKTETSAKAEIKKTETKKTVKANPQVLFKTTSGDITIELYPKEAPITVANFLKYIDEGFYNGVIFHRVVQGFVVQAGGFTFDFQRKQTHDPIKNESNNGLKNLRGTLSMARTSIIDSATSQFFININNNPALDSSAGRHGYAVFGKVINGMNIVKKIEAEPRGLHRAHPEAPNFAVIIEKATRL